MVTCTSKIELMVASFFPFVGLQESDQNRGQRPANRSGGSKRVQGKTISIVVRCPHLFWSSLRSLFLHIWILRICMAIGWNLILVTGHRRDRQQSRQNICHRIQTLWNHSYFESKIKYGILSWGVTKKQNITSILRLNISQDPSPSEVPYAQKNLGFDDR